MASRRSQKTLLKVIAKQTGGERGIRTLDGALRPHTPLAGERLQPLGHLSARSQYYHDLKHRLSENFQLIHLRRGKVHSPLLAQPFLAEYVGISLRDARKSL